MSATKLTTASVLAFERKLANSDAFMYSGNWSDIDKTDPWQPIGVREKAVRGVISNRQKNAITSDDAKLDAEIQKANLQTVDVAALPANKDTLKVSFSLRVLGNLSTPSVCNKPEYQEKLTATIESYIQQQQFTELASRYAENIANGRFLWRNRVGAEAVVIHVREKADQQTKQAWQFNAHDFNLRNFTIAENDLAELANVIQQGLIGGSFAFLEIDAYARLGQAQEVFPSQELVLSADDKKSKHLYHINDIAGMHSQKIGNALRTIDTWYPEQKNQDLGPIAVEPFGSVTSRGKAYRQPTAKADFYTLLDRWVLKDETPPVEQQHYVMATLIRGGVFGDGS